MKHCHYWPKHIGLMNTWLVCHHRHDLPLVLYIIYRQHLLGLTTFEVEHTEKTMSAEHAVIQRHLSLCFTDHTYVSRHFFMVMTYVTCHLQKKRIALEENSRVAGGDTVEQARQATNHRGTMSDGAGCFTEHQSNWALCAPHSFVLSSCLQSSIKLY